MTCQDLDRVPQIDGATQQPCSGDLADQLVPVPGWLWEHPHDRLVYGRDVRGPANGRLSEDERYARDGCDEERPKVGVVYPLEARLEGVSAQGGVGPQVDHS